MKEKIKDNFSLISEKFIEKCLAIENKYFNNISIQKIAFILTIIFFTMLFYILNSMTPLLADDYGWGYIRGSDHQPIKNLKDILVSVYDYYFTWGGRIGGNLLSEIFTLTGKPIFNIFNTFIYILNTLLIYYICNQSKKIKISLYIAIHLLIWFFTPDYGQVMFWLSGSCNYLWLITPVLIMILIFRKYSINQNIIKDNIINILVIFILGIFAGWSNENAGAGMLVVLTLYLTYYYFNNIQMPKYILSGYIGSLIGYSLLIIAPGNFAREVAEQSIVHTSLIFRLFMITYFFVMFLLGMFIILSIVFWIGKRYFNLKKDNSIYQSLIFIVASIGSAYSMIASPTSPERTWFCIVVYMAIAIGVIYDKFDFTDGTIKEETIFMIRRLTASVTTLSMCIFLVMYLDTSLATFEILSQTKERENYILSERAKGNMDIMTPEIYHKYPLLSEHDGLHGLSDITTDPNHFVNRAVCDYYGINSIVAITVDDKQYLNQK